MTLFVYPNVKALLHQVRVLNIYMWLFCSIDWGLFNMITLNAWLLQCIRMGGGGGALLYFANSWSSINISSESMLQDKQIPVTQKNRASQKTVQRLVYVLFFCFQRFVSPLIASDDVKVMWFLVWSASL